MRFVTGQYPNVKPRDSVSGADSDPAAAKPTVSPLTKSQNIALIRRIPVSLLAARWREKFGIDVAHDLDDTNEVMEYRCLDTGLYFFSPRTAAGSAELYRRLSAFSWYYMEEKWEYDVTIRGMTPATRFLEIGCGHGSFLELAARNGVRGLGIELSAEAAEHGRSLGRPIECIDLAAYAKAHAEEFDFVCGFQVLEHVPNPHAFIEAAVRLVRVGGRIVFSTPNADSFLFRGPGNLLDMPPHHMSRWGKQAFRSLSRLFPLRLLYVRNEPLAQYHASWYAARIAGVTEGLLPAGVRKCLRWLASGALKRSALLRRSLTGHTHLACFQKLTEIDS